MKRIETRTQRRRRRKAGIRKRVFGMPDRPRLTVYRSLKHIYAQIIDDLSGHTLASASTLEKSLGMEQGGNRDAAAAVGKIVAERAKEKGVERVSFDRNGYRYHGRVRAVADSVREAGVEL